MADVMGVNEDQMRRQGGGNNTTMKDAYLTSLLKDMMRSMAPTNNRSFHLARAAVDPSTILCKKFPVIDEGHD